MEHARPPRGSEASGSEPPPGAFTEALADLGETLEGARSVAAAAAAVATFTTVHLGARRAGVAVSEGPGAPTLLAGTSLGQQPSDASTVDRQLGLMASRLAPGQMISIGDTRTPDLRATWASAAAGLGLLSAQIVAMPPLRGRSTSLHMFWQWPQVFLPEARDRAGRVAMQAGYSLRHIDRVANLVAAMSTRAIIGQAQGIIMERYRLTSAQAMSYLRRQSQETQTPIRDVAARFVSEGDQELHRGGSGWSGPS